MSRFFVDKADIGDDTVTITNRDDVKHLTKVLRHKEGDIIEISDGIALEYEIKLIAVCNDFAEGLILEKKPFQREPKIKVTLYQGIPKQGKMESIVQKTVELGVYRIIPMFTKRTVVEDKGNFKNKIQRWQKVADEAVKQCRRGIIPTVFNAIGLKEVLEMMKENDLNLFFYEDETVVSLKKVLRTQEIKKEESDFKIGMIIGPEGGFSPEEADLITKNGAKSVSLGKTILRTETAPVAALAMIMYEMELNEELQ